MQLKSPCIMRLALYPYRKLSMYFSSEAKTYRGCRKIVAFIKKFFTVQLLLLAHTSQVQACPVANTSIQISAKGLTITAEVAATLTSQMCGLSLRHSLPVDHGMLFTFDQDRIVSFWMKDTFIPLSIAYLDADGKILEIYDLDPRYPENQYISKVPVRYALEVNQGWFIDNDIKIGDRLEFDL